ncbi:hypothetical protein Esti_006112 [Eimeria stiedai]
MMMNQQANHAGRSTIASGVSRELKTSQQANAQLNAVAANCCSAQGPLKQAVHVKLSQETVRQPSDPLSLWWRQAHQNVPLVLAAQTPHEGRLTGRRVNLMAQDILALLDAGATHSFVSHRLVDEHQLQTKAPQKSTGRFNLSVAEVTASDLRKRLGEAETDTVRTEAKAAHAELVESLNQLGSQASALVRRQPKSYKEFECKARRVPI